jgi:hypothetical protein
LLVLLTFLGAPAVQTCFAAVAARSSAQPEKDSDPGPIKPIMDGMHGAEARLKAGDTGADTRTIQEKVVNDLQKLIDAAKSKSQDGSQQQNSGSRPESGSQNRFQGKPAASETPSGSGGAGSTGAGSSRTGQPGRKPGAGKPSATDKEKKPTDGPRHHMLRDVWGHLPPALRERVPSDFHETILPAYDDLVRRYFEALLSGPTSTGPDQMPAQGLQSPALPTPALPAQ